VRRWSKTWGGPAVIALAGLYRRTIVRSTRAIAVVGSFGKTTTMMVTLAALGLPRRHIGRNTRLGTAAVVLHMRPWQRLMVMEVGISRPGQMAGRARMIRPDVVVVTCIGSEHNQSFGSLEATRAEKVEAVRALPAAGLAVLNGDDPHVRWMAGETRARVLTFGFEPDCDIRASGMAIDGPHGMRFTLHIAGTTRDVRTRLLGIPAVYAVLAAVAVGRHEGVPLDDLVERLADCSPEPGRLQPVALATGAVILGDAFKAGEETVHAALDVLEALPARRRIVVFGGIEAPRPSAKARYRHIGQRIGQMAARAIVFDVGADLGPLRTGLKQGGLSPEAIHVVRDVREATSQLSDLGEGDIVLLKGRRVQRLERVILALQGHDVRCRVAACPFKNVACNTCPLLARGWSPG
jgi:UDP-N-acetylmuramyl pentapeptide synthase